MLEPVFDSVPSQLHEPRPVWIDLACVVDDSQSWPTRYNPARLRHVGHRAWPGALAVADRSRSPRGRRGMQSGPRRSQPTWCPNDAACADAGRGPTTRSAGTAERLPGPLTSRSRPQSGIPPHRQPPSPCPGRFNGPRDPGSAQPTPSNRTRYLGESARPGPAVARAGGPCPAARATLKTYRKRAPVDRRRAGGHLRDGPHHSGSMSPQGGHVACSTAPKVRPAL